MKITIKQVSLADLDNLMEWRMEVLHSVFGTSQNENMQDLYLANREYYQKFIPNKEHITVFAEIDQMIVGCGGFCQYNEMPSPDNPTGKCAYLMNIYTRQSYRGQGVGRAVVEWLIGYAKEQGITKIYLETSDCGRMLYESLGFQDMQHYMKL